MSKVKIRGEDTLEREKKIRMTVAVNNFIDIQQNCIHWMLSKSRTMQCFYFSANENNEIEKKIYIYCYENVYLSAVWNEVGCAKSRENHSLTHFKAWRHDRCCYLSIVLSHHRWEMRCSLFICSSFLYVCICVLFLFLMFDHKIGQFELSENRHTQSIRAHTINWVVQCHYIYYGIWKIYDPCWNRVARFSFSVTFSLGILRSWSRLCFANWIELSIWILLFATNWMDLALHEQIMV